MTSPSLESTSTIAAVRIRNRESSAGLRLGYCASLLHSFACTRATSLQAPLPSGLNADASPSRTSNAIVLARRCVDARQ